MQNSGQDGRTSPQQSGESSSKRSSTTDSSSSSNDGSNDGNGDGNGMSGSLTSLVTPSSFASDLVSPGLSFSSSTHIEFRNVSFRYVTRNAPVLTDFSLKVARGSTLALAGKSGCGELKNWCAFIGAVVVQRTLLFLSPLLIHLLLIPPLLLSLSFLRLWWCLSFSFPYSSPSPLLCFPSVSFLLLPRQEFRNLPAGALLPARLRRDLRRRRRH